MIEEHVSNTFFLFDKIDLDSAMEVVAWITSANMMEVPYPFLTLQICSDGGDLGPAFAIIDAITHSNIPVRTIGIGEIYSSGFMIFMAGVKGHRMLMPNCGVMSHRFSAGSDGKFHDLKASQTEYNLLHEKMVRHYVNCTGLTKKEVDKKLLGFVDVFLTPEQAVELGAADIVG